MQSSIKEQNYKPPDLTGGLRVFIALTPTLWISDTTELVHSYYTLHNGISSLETTRFRLNYHLSTFYQVKYTNLNSCILFYEACLPHLLTFF